MADHFAFRVYSANARARVFAFQVNASQMAWALAVADAFGLAVRRGPNEVGQAGAFGRFSV